LRLVGFEHRGLAIGRHRLGVIPELEEDDGQIALEHPVPGPKRCRPADEFHGLRRIATLERGEPEQVERVGMIGLDGEHLPAK
jgi:hypothetical protein